MKKLQSKAVDDLFEAILSLKSVEECYMFFEDVCTIKEVLDMSERLRVAKMLFMGANYSEVGKITGMSSATIARIRKCLDYGSGGYRLILEKNEEKNDGD